MSMRRKFAALMQEEGIVGLPLRSAGHSSRSSPATETKMTLLDSEHEPPETSAGDTAYEIAKTAAGYLAPGGDLIIEKVFGSPFARRQREWMEEIAAAIRRLEEKRGIHPEELRDNPAFIDAAITAYQSFIKTSDKEKRTALRNAVLNAALPNAPSVIQQQIFLVLVDRLTPLHLAVMSFFRDPPSWQDAHGRRIGPYNARVNPKPRTILEDAFPQLGGSELADAIWADLDASALVRRTGLDNSGEGEAVMKNRLTTLGNRFVQFISDPLK
jgi:hypothetical protein